MRNVVWGLVILLIILHQDYWFWYTDYQVLGFIPTGLFYHAMISVGAGVTWYLATVYCWPTNLDVDEADTPDGNPADGTNADGREVQS